MFVVWIYEFCQFITVIFDSFDVDFRVDIFDVYSDGDPIFVIDGDLEICVPGVADYGFFVCVGGDVNFDGEDRVVVVFSELYLYRVFGGDSFV